MIREEYQTIVSIINRVTCVIAIESAKNRASDCTEITPESTLTLRQTNVKVNVQVLALIGRISGDSR